MNEKKAIFMNTASQVVVRIAGLFFTLISVKLISNYFGTIGTGEFNTISTYTSFFIVFADLGLFSVTVREVVKNPSKEKQIIANVFVVRLITALIAAIAAAVIVFLTGYNSDIKLGTLIAAGFIFFNLLSSIYDVILQTRLQMQFSALAEFISKLVTLIALTLIVHYHGSFLYLAGTITLNGALILIIKWFFARRFLAFGPAYNPKVALWITNLAWPMGIVFILNNLYFKIDTLILFITKGAAEVGIYSVAYKVLEVTTFVGSYYANALKPLFSRNITDNKIYLANIVRKSATVMLLLSLPITILGAAFPKEIILFLSNSEFTPGSTTLVILTFALPLIYLDTLLGEILVASDERRLLMKIAIFILSFNFLANLLIIPHYSYLGAGVTTVISEFLLLLINLHYTRKIVHYRLDWQKITLIVVASLIMLIFALLIRHLKLHFLILMAISSIVYVLAIYAFGLVKISSLKQIVKE